MTPRQLPVRLLLPLAAVVLLTAACSGASSTPASQPATPSSAAAPSTPQTQPMITIKNFRYDVPASVKAGATVTVKNLDGEAHTVTVAGGAKVTVQGGATARLTAPAKAGKYPISCDFHGNMHADLVVT